MFLRAQQHTRASHHQLCNKPRPPPLLPRLGALYLDACNPGFAELHKSLGDGRSCVLDAYVYRLALGVVGDVGNHQPRAGDSIKRSR